ncbi:MAG: exodeoxyribonuclease VII small subunit [Lachnospiraceae bacterium]|nr:exodeoxyribonuclease VII small subunit [Lachnospiraceae bacterium]
MAKENTASIEENFKEIEKILDLMDEEEVPLEESFKYYEEGMQLLKDTAAKIETVEKKVKVLQEDGSLKDFAEESRE